MKQFLKHVLVIVVIIFLGFFLQRKYIKEFPSYIHAWAQSDHYALAQGFTNNGFNFFKPETFVYNHQFPHAWMEPSAASITAVDFPLNNYIPAIMMKILGKKSPWIFRSYILFCSFIGLFFLFKLSQVMGNNLFRSLLVMLVAACSPLFVYYQSGFLPTIPSLALAITGIYCYVNYIKLSTRNYFLLTVFFLTLAALCRTTFAIPLIAVFSVELNRIIRKQTSLRDKLIPVIISIAVLAGYFLYNSFLRNKYGSIFLSRFLPPDDINEALEIVRTIKYRWSFTYFSITQWLVLMVTLIASLYFVIVKKERLARVKKHMLLLTGIIFSGCICFFILMMKQFPEHDYYFLDTFFLPILLLLILLLTIIPVPENKTAYVISSLSIMLISIPMLLYANDSQQQRRITGTWDKTNETILNFKDSQKFLDSLNVAKDARILAIDIAAPNIPFLLMQRKGYAVVSTEKELLKKAVTWDFDYAVIQNRYFMTDVYSSFPEIVDKLERVADNRKLSLCKKRETTSAYFHLVSFDKPAEKNWENVHPVSGEGFLGTNAGVLLASQEFGLTFKTVNLPELRQKSCFLFFSGMFKIKSLAKCDLVVSVNENGKNIFYHSRNLKDYLKENNEWQKLDFHFELPRVKSDNYEFGIFLWNGKSEMLLDDFGFKIF